MKGSLMFGKAVVVMATAGGGGILLNEGLRAHTRDPVGIGLGAALLVVGLTLFGAWFWRMR